MENSTYKYILSVTTYSIGNSKCSIGNVYIPVKKHSLEWLNAWNEVSTWLEEHSSHASILIGDYNVRTSKLNSIISKWASNIWSIMPTQGSNISWSNGSRSSDIDHAIVNDKMMDLISHGHFVNYYPISDHKPFLIFNKEFPSDSFSFPKKFIKWDRIKCNEVSKSIFNNNRFSVLEDEFYNGENQSTDALVNSFITSAYSLAGELGITTTDNKKKPSYRMSKKVYVLQKLKIKKYKLIKKHGNIRNLDEFIKVTSSFKRLCHNIKRKCNQFRKEERLHWINIGCKLAINNDHRGTWNWIKKSAKTGILNAPTSQPIKDDNGDIAYSTKDQLEVWFKHYKLLASDPSYDRLNKPFWSSPRLKKLFKFLIHKTWNINQEISREEIREAILSIPNFKASGPDGIPIEFYKAMVSEEIPEDNSNYGYNFLYLLFNRIWDGDFPGCWNNATIVSIPKKGDPTDCNNYRGISIS